MVDKVDRPNAPSPYAVQRTKEAKDNQHQSSDNNEEQSAHYRNNLKEDVTEWKKFGGQTTVIRPISAPKSRISALTFRGISLRGGNAILEVDVLWQDQRMTHGAMIRVSRMEEMLRAKRLKPGEAVPEALWGSGENVDLGIPQNIATSGSFAIPKISEDIAPPQRTTSKRPALLSKLGIIDHFTGKIHWTVLALYFFMIIILALAIGFSFR